MLAVVTLRDAVLLTRAIDERAPAVAKDTVWLIKKLWRFGASQGHDIDAKEMADLEKQNPEEPREHARQNRDSAYVFPTAHSKRLGDASMGEKSLTRAAARNRCGLEHWTPHDLRRIAATHMS